jgi:hypothetical protein
MESAMRVMPYSLPIIDEEYPEYVAWAHSVMRARTRFVGVDLGARWGTWGARAVGFLRMLNPLPYSLLFVEANEEHCDGLRFVNKLNNITNYTLFCENAKAELLIDWLSRQDRVDIIDMDIQHAEKELLEQDPISEELRRALRAHVVRIIIGTHSRETHHTLRRIMLEEGWELITEVPHAFDNPCSDDVYASRARHLFPKGVRKSPEKLLEKRCYFPHALFGPIHQYDGSLIFDNPQFLSPDPSKRFTFDKTYLCTDDLIKDDEDCFDR